MLMFNNAYSANDAVLLGADYTYLSYKIKGQVSSFQNLASTSAKAQRDKVKLHAATVSLGYKISKPDYYLIPEISFGKGVKKDTIAATGTYSPLFGAEQKLNLKLQFELEQLISLAIKTGWQATDDFAITFISSYSHAKIKKSIRDTSSASEHKSNEAINLFGIGVGFNYEIINNLSVQASYELKGEESISAGIRYAF